MEHVVYLLGAGFSAPLGLPVVANFLLKAKDLYFGDAKKYQHFHEVFSQIAALSRVKNVFNSDLYDIEEILSILQMQDHLENRNRGTAFANLIRDTILAYTPHPSSPAHREHWYDDLTLLRDKLWHPYISFVANLFALRAGVQDPGGRPYQISQTPHPKFTYDLVSLNYDGVCETAAGYLQVAGQSGNWLSFRRSSADPEMGGGGGRRPLLAKLHGSVDNTAIVPPTWSKALSPDIVDQWRAAQSALRGANHVRILGYSLPTGDSYLRYFLKSALAEAEHLKSFDVLCLDPDGTVKQRYADLVAFRYGRFVSANTADYLSQTSHVGSVSAQVAFDVLEDGHQRFFERAG
jgi:hypothetical protein